MINISSVENNKYILGINGGVRPGYQDISAVIVSGGKVLAAVEEERITRVKHTAGQLPTESIKEVLNITGITIEDVDLVAFHGSTWGDQIDNVLKKHFLSYFGHFPPLKRFHHHDCHAASTYYLSGFKDAVIVTVDGSGDGVSTQVSVGKAGEIEVLKRYERPQSLGIYYSLITQLCGFTRDADEYKLMGLGAYGDKSKYNFDKLLEITDNGYSLNEDLLVSIEPGQPSPSRYEMLFDKELTEFFQMERRHLGTIPKKYMDLAASAQFQLEKALKQLVSSAIRDTGLGNVCMAGGVALNCLANQKIENMDEVKELFIQPASSDAGVSLGAALLGSRLLEGSNFTKQEHTFFGTETSSQEVKKVLEKCNIAFSESDKYIELAAESLFKKKVIAWYQGRMEFGPRALGNRSILADPSGDDIQSKVNHKVKFREGFRPFGASVLEEDFHLFFEAKCDEAPYMTKVFGVKPEYQDLLAGVTHVDGTCRVQTINEKQNPKYYHLIKTFKEKSGHGVLLNTSFNLSHEPIVCQPREAVASFFASGLDELYIESCIIKK
jgi:carbamoyltransferase